MVFTDHELNQFFRYSLSLTGKDEEAFDLMQTCLEKWIHLGLNHIEKPHPYFLKMLRNQFYDNVQKEERTSDDIFSLEGRDWEDMVVQKNQVATILESLRPEEREMIYLWAYVGLTFDEIGQILERPRGTLLAKFHRLKSKIRRECEI